MVGALLTQMQVGAQAEQVGRLRFQRQQLLQHRLGGEEVVLLQQQSEHGAAGLRLLGIELGGAPIMRQCFVLAAAALERQGSKEMSAIVLGLELGGAHELVSGLGRLVFLEQQHAEVEARGKELGIGFERLAVGLQGIGGAAGHGVGVSEIEQSVGMAGMTLEEVLQQTDGSVVLLLIERLLSRGQRALRGFLR